MHEIYQDACEKMPVLEVRNLSIEFKRYDGAFSQDMLNTVKNVNISVSSGELTAIVGASGSGKSLLAHAILGILPYNALPKGDIRYMGETLTAERIKQLRGKDIVLVPQSVSYLDPLMKTGTQLMLGKHAKVDGISTDELCKERAKRAEVKKLLSERIKSTFSRYRLEENTTDLYPFELSGGMTRRVLISSAVICEPKLVIADEPTPGLNIETAKQVLSHFREMADNGAGVLLITHDLELALECADRIIVFYDGETIDEVIPEDFEKRLGEIHPYTRELWQAMPKNWETE